MANPSKEKSPAPEPPEAGLSEASRSPEEGAPDAWEERFAELVAYKAKYGHCRMSRQPGMMTYLGRWVHQQRKEQYLGRMEPEHEARLEALGFEWQKEIRDEAWEKHFQHLKAYQEEHGHLGVMKPEDSKLWSWVAQQRRNYLMDKMGVQRRERLESIGFTWSKQEGGFKMQVAATEVNWSRMYGLLEKHIAQEGLDSLGELSQQSSPLGRWLWWQCSKARLGQLPPERRARLEAAGALARLVVLEPPVDWQAHYAELREFSQKHGHTRGKEPMEPHLRRWCHQQRLNRKNNRLEPTLTALLDELDFEWGDSKLGMYGEPRRGHRDWIWHYEKLQSFHQEHGHCDVPPPSQDGNRLYRWANIQRNLKKKGLLSQQKEALLEALNFPWTVNRPEIRDDWEMTYQRLKDRHKEHGHLEIDPKHDRMLTRWCRLQWRARESGLLSGEKIARLDALGFTWAPEIGTQPTAEQPPSTKEERQWDRLYQRLLGYHQQHGHCQVPIDDSHYGKLAEWVFNQRYRLKEGKLTAAQEALLAELGFE